LDRQKGWQKAGPPPKFDKKTSKWFALNNIHPVDSESINCVFTRFADETSLPTLAPGTGAVKRAWLWAYASDDSTFGGSGPTMVAYRFEDSRSGECVRRHLGGYDGILQVDGYAAYNLMPWSYRT
jgi:hypothetical protein